MLNIIHPRVLSFFKLKIPLQLADFSDHKYRKGDNTFIDIYADIDKIKKIGFIKYNIRNGQVGIFRLDKEYRNRGLGKQILSHVIQDMKKHGTPEIWAVTMKNDPFWSNVYNKSFSWYDYRQLHSSVTSDGYKMKI